MQNYDSDLAGSFGSLGNSLLSSLNVLFFGSFEADFMINSSLGIFPRVWLAVMTVFVSVMLLNLLIAMYVTLARCHTPACMLACMLGESHAVLL